MVGELRGKGVGHFHVFCSHLSTQETPPTVSPASKALWSLPCALLFSEVTLVFFFFFPLLWVCVVGDSRYVPPPKNTHRNQAQAQRERGGGRKKESPAQPTQARWKTFCKHWSNRERESVCVCVGVRKTHTQKPMMRTVLIDAKKDPSCSRVCVCGRETHPNHLLSSHPCRSSSCSGFAGETVTRQP